MDYPKVYLDFAERVLVGQDSEIAYDMPITAFLPWWRPPGDLTRRGLDGRKLFNMPPDEVTLSLCFQAAAHKDLQ